MENLELGKFMGKVSDQLDKIEDFIKCHDEKDQKVAEKLNDRLITVEKKQEKFAWYIGVAVGIGAVIMFVVDRLFELYQRIK